MPKNFKYFLLGAVIIFLLIVALSFLQDNSRNADNNQSVSITPSPVTSGETIEPVQARQQFIQSCLKNIEYTKNCNCILQYIESKLPITDYFEQEKATLAANTLPSIFIEAATSCKSHQ